MKLDITKKRNHWDVERENGSDGFLKDSWFGYVERYMFHNKDKGRNVWITSKERVIYKYDSEKGLVVWKELKNGRVTVNGEAGWIGTQYWMYMCLWIEIQSSRCGNHSWEPVSQRRFACSAFQSSVFERMKDEDNPRSRCNRVQAFHSSTYVERLITAYRYGWTKEQKQGSTQTESTERGEQESLHNSSDSKFVGFPRVGNVLESGQSKKPQISLR